MLAGDGKNLSSEMGEENVGGGGGGGPDPVHLDGQEDAASSSATSIAEAGSETRSVLAQLAALSTQTFEQCLVPDADPRFFRQWKGVQKFLYEMLRQRSLNAGLAYGLGQLSKEELAALEVSSSEQIRTSTGPIAQLLQAHPLPPSSEFDRTKLASGDKVKRMIISRNYYEFQYHIACLLSQIGRKLTQADKSGLSTDAMARIKEEFDREVGRWDTLHDFLLSSVQPARSLPAHDKEVLIAISEEFIGELKAEMSLLVARSVRPAEALALSPRRQGASGKVTQRIAAFQTKAAAELALARGNQLKGQGNNVMFIHHKRQQSQFAYMDCFKAFLTFAVCVREGKDRPVTERENLLAAYALLPSQFLQRKPLAQLKREADLVGLGKSRLLQITQTLSAVRAELDRGMDSIAYSTWVSPPPSLRFYDEAFQEHQVLVAPPSSMTPASRVGHYVLNRPNLVEDQRRQWTVSYCPLRGAGRHLGPTLPIRIKIDCEQSFQAFCMSHAQESELPLSALAPYIDHDPDLTDLNGLIRSIFHDAPPLTAQTFLPAGQEFAYAQMKDEYLIRAMLIELTRVEQREPNSDNLSVVSLLTRILNRISTVPAEKLALVKNMLEYSGVLPPTRAHEILLAVLALKEYLRPKPFYPELIPSHREEAARLVEDEVALNLAASSPAREDEALLPPDTTSSREERDVREVGSRREGLQLLRWGLVAAGGISTVIFPPLAISSLPIAGAAAYLTPTRSQAAYEWSRRNRVAAAAFILAVSACSAASFLYPRWALQLRELLGTAVESLAEHTTVSPIPQLASVEIDPFVTIATISTSILVPALVLLLLAQLCHCGLQHRERGHEPNMSEGLDQAEAAQQHTTEPTETTPLVDSTAALTLAVPPAHAVAVGRPFAEEERLRLRVNSPYWQAAQQGTATPPLVRATRPLLPEGETSPNARAQ